MLLPGHVPIHDASLPPFRNWLISAPVSAMIAAAAVCRIPGTLCANSLAARNPAFACTCWETRELRDLTQVCQPAGVVAVRLVAPQILHMLRIGQQNLQVSIVQDVVNRPPVRSRALHDGVRTSPFLKPHSQALQVLFQRAESPYFFGRHGRGTGSKRTMALRGWRARALRKQSSAWGSCLRSNSALPRLRRPSTY